MSQVDFLHFYNNVLYNYTQLFSFYIIFIFFFVQIIYKIINSRFQIKLNLMNFIILFLMNLSFLLNVAFFSNLNFLGVSHKLKIKILNSFIF